MGVFDGMSDAIIDALGEDVIYTPIATGLPAIIRVIWWTHPMTSDVGDVEVDARRSGLSVKTSDIAAPAEGDRVERLKDGTVRVVATPILPDDQGVTVCNLAAPDSDDD